MIPYLALEQWTWGFHDQTVMGWGLTVAYFVTAAAAGGAAWRAGGAGQGMERTAWSLLALALLLLSLNKQLDLQNLLRERAKELYLQQGWHFSHRHLLRIVLTGILVTLAGGALALQTGLPRLAATTRRALVLFLVLTGVILLRFLPIPGITGVLGFTFLETQSAGWHFHGVELVELALVGWIAWEALREGERLMVER